MKCGRLLFDVLSATTDDQLAEVTVDGTDTTGTLTITTKQDADTTVLSGELAELKFVNT